MVRGYLFDTCLISEAGKPMPSEAVVCWMQALPAHDVWTSVIVFGELHSGVQLLEEGKRKRSLIGWLNRQRKAFGDRCLGIDEPIARTWGELTAARKKRGAPLPVADGLIAATALERGLTLATRNVDDFADCGVDLFNPWSFQKSQ
jgi:toxin FitB